MKKLLLVPALLLSVAAGSAMATTSTDPVTGVVQGTGNVAKDVGNGAVNAAEQVGGAAKELAVGAGKAVESVGKGAENLVTGK